MADLTITAANVKPITAKTSTGIAGASVTAGQTVYLDSADGKYKLADANSATAAARSVKGVALNAASADQPLVIAESGTINPGATATVGAIYVQSATPGGIAPAADLASGHYVSIVGVCTAANVLTLGIVNYGAAVP